MGCIQSKSLGTLEPLPTPAASGPESPRALAAQHDRLLLTQVAAQPPRPPSVPSLEAPEPRQVAAGFAAMVGRVLGQPSPGYASVVPEHVRDATAALTVLTDPRGRVGASMLATARAEGWLACVREHGALLASKRLGYGLGPIDGLLYRGAITPHEYWTASTMFALWRDSQPAPLSAEQTLGEPGEPVAFGGRYVRWDSARAFDLSVPAQRGQALSMAYALSPWTRVVHADSVGRAAASWQRSPERFMYLMPIDNSGTYPSFGLSPFLAAITPWKLHVALDLQLPLCSLSLFQHDLDLFHPAPLSAVPRLGTDSVSSLQQQVLHGRRAAGISHGFPWSDRHMHQHADFLATGEAGFAWHDLAHLSVGSVDPPAVRTTLVRLHQELSAHCKTLALPEQVGPFPFRRLFTARLFDLTDQGRADLDVRADEALQRNASLAVGRSLGQLLLSSGVAAAANVRTNFLRHMPAGTAFYAPALDSETRQGLRDNMPPEISLRREPELQPFFSTWEHFTALQVAHATHWLQQQGHAVTLQADEQPAAVIALVTMRHPYEALPTDSHLFNGAVVLVSRAAGEEPVCRMAPFDPAPLAPDPFPADGHWKARQR